MIEITSLLASSVLNLFGLPNFVSGFADVSGLAIFLVPFLHLEYKMNTRKNSNAINQRTNQQGLLCIPQ